MDILTGAIAGGFYALMGIGNAWNGKEPIQPDKVIVTVVAGGILGGLGQLLNVDPANLSTEQFGAVLTVTLLYVVNKLKGTFGWKNILTKEQQ